MGFDWLCRMGRELCEESMSKAQEDLLTEWYYSCPQPLAMYLNNGTGAISLARLRRQFLRHSPALQRDQFVGPLLMPEWYCALVEYFTLYPMAPAEFCADFDHYPDLVAMLSGEATALWSFSIAQELGQLFASDEFGSLLPWGHKTEMDRVLYIVTRHPHTRTVGCMLNFLQLALKDGVNPLYSVSYIDQILRYAPSNMVDRILKVHAKVLLHLSFNALRVGCGQD